MKKTILVNVTWKVLPSNDTFTEPRLVEVCNVESLREDTILELATEATMNYFKSNHPNLEVVKITTAQTIIISIPSNGKPLIELENESK